MRVAVIGGGISGLAAATLLQGERTAGGAALDVTLLESGDRAGGHANTIEVTLDGETYWLDTGFMVFNERTYPVFIDLLRRWGVASQASDMSFGVSSESSGLEYAGTGLSGIFARRSNLLSAAHWRMFVDVARFARLGRRLLRERDDATTIGELLTNGRWSTRFVDEYLLALGSAIWSCDPQDLRRFPARALAAFLDNHGLLTLLDRPAWRTIVGGSQSYVNAAVRELGSAVRVGCEVRGVRRTDSAVEILTTGGSERFDHVVMAVHADTALDLLVDASPAEKEVLGAFAYQPNDVVLHHDASMLPRSRRAWASWNHHVGSNPTSRVQVTYHLNRLLDIDAPHEFCVTLNRTEEIDPTRILWQGTMSHPLYSATAFAAQRRWREISGIDRTHYCGAYWGWGFHEDGAASGKRVADAVLAADAPATGAARGR